MVFAALVLIASAVAIFAFWAFVIGVYRLCLGHVDFFSVDPADLELETVQMREGRLHAETIDINKDIATIMAPITMVVPPAGTPPPKQKPLIQLGIAENRVVSQRDLQFNIDDYCDLWLCDGRPVIFALLQAIPVLVATALLSLPVLADGVSLTTFVLMPFVWAGVSTLVVSLVIGFFAYKPVAENTVIGVYRFGKQLNGFLGPGMQFVVPWIEEIDEIPFQTLVWGPQTGEVDDGFHIEGIADIDTNPATGIFAPLLRGRWPITVIVQVTFHFERSRKKAWWEILNRWSDTKELGEQIASAINSVLVTRVRELEITEEFHSPTEAMQGLNALQSELPETCGPIMQSLVELRVDLPVIFERVVISAVKAGDELQQVLQVQDEAWVTRYREEKAGEAVADRMANLFRIFKDNATGISDEDLRDAVLRLSEQEVQRLFALAGSKDGSVEALVRAFVAGKVQDVTTQ